MDENKSGRVDLPIPLNEFQNLSVFQAAQVYTLQLLEWAEQTTSCTNQQGSPIELKNNFLSWLKDFNPEERVVGPIAAYKDVLKSANRIIPFIKSDVQRLLKKRSGLGYSSTMMIDKSSAKSSEVCEADAFLYENLEEPLEKQGKESQVECLNCKSTDCSEIETEVDDSTAVDTQAKLFCLLEQEFTNEGPKILIIGSGIGSFAYGTYLFCSQSKSIVSCEWNTQMCQLQIDVTNKHGMTGKVVVDNCICPQDPGVIKASNLVIICSRVNTLSTKQIGDVFKKLKESMKRGSLIVSCKQEIQSYIDQLGEVEKDYFDDWVTLKYEIKDRIKGSDFDNFISDSDDDYKLNYYIYTVM